VLVTACASTLGDGYCALAWGARLAADSDGPTAGGVLRGDDGGLTGRERVLATWARKVTSDPNGTAAADVQELRDAGYDDAQILAITTFVALRLAFSTVNDALGVRPDEQLHTTTPAAVLDAVTFGRPIAGN
jgi:alkylhydroperoxidase family enzyme